MSYKKICDICGKNIGFNEKSYQIIRKAWTEKELDICQECFGTIKTAIEQKQLPKVGEDE